MTNGITNTLKDIKKCTVCATYLKDGVNPVLTASEDSKIIIIGQAPGRVVHGSGIPWDDKSGDNLRRWLGIGKDEFYDPGIISLIPMGFCYPGTGSSGDLPPRPECAPLWHEPLLSNMRNVRLILLIGQYAQKYYLGKRAKQTLTETVYSYANYLPSHFPLPHPSPRNNIWLSKNPWFQQDVLPALKHEIGKVLS